MARAAHVERLITKSISGHMTDEMVDHYSSINPKEQRESIRRIACLFVPDASPPSGPLSGPSENTVVLFRKKAG